MAGSDVSVAENIDNRHIGKQPIRKIYIKWTSDDATGDASGAIPGGINGQILCLATKPGAGGDQPTNLYDITLEDEFSYDVLEGLGADRSNVNPERVVIVDEVTVTGNFGRHPPVAGALTFKVANAGNTKKGEAILYVK
jgi:hypothetical protein